MKRTEREGGKEIDKGWDVRERLKDGGWKRRQKDKMERVIISSTDGIEPYDVWS